MTAKPRSQALKVILKGLRDQDKSLEWLGAQLDPPVTRQAVHGWVDVPSEHVITVEQVIGLSLGLTRHEIRPDLYPRDGGYLPPKARKRSLPVKRKSGRCAA